MASSPSLGTFTLHCLITGEVDIFTVEISPGDTVYELKHQILTAGSLHETDAKDLKLWKMDIPLTGQVNLSAVTAPAHEPMKNLGCCVGDFWPSPPPGRMLHVLVTKIGRSANPQIQDTWCPRRDTVRILYNKLSVHYLIQVRGTPGSGKTTLADLLHHYIRSQQPGAEIYRVSSWPENITGTLNSRLDAASIPRFSINRKTYLLWDNAELTYHDAELWEAFFKNTIQRHGGDYFAVLFCCYGSATSEPNRYGLAGTLRLQPCGQVSLHAQESPHPDHSPCGLLLTFEEFTDVIERYRGSDGQPIRLDSHLQLQFFNWTAGHAGALAGMLEIISRQLRNQPSEKDLDIDEFLTRHPYQQFITSLQSQQSFARGLPVSESVQKPSIAKTFQALLQCNSISREDADHEGLNECIKNGWVHSDMYNLPKARNPQERFGFPSPLHATCLAWMLMPRHDAYVCGHVQTIREMSLAVIRKFNPSRLRLQAPFLVRSSFRDRSVEAVYREEFYRGLYEVTEGGTIATPGYSCTSGDSLGRICFFVPSKKWVVEILRDGEDFLPEHRSRLGICGAYGRWIAGGEVDDYVLLDFRTTRPREQIHSLRNLLHVVFEQDFAHVSVLDQGLEELDAFVLVED